MRKLLLTLLTLLIFGFVKSQSIIYVDSSVTTSGAGNSWGTATKTITEAITISGSGDIIKIAKGTYQEDTTLIIPHTLTLQGGFSTGGGLTQDTNANRSIIDGNNLHGVISKDGNFKLTLNHLIVQNGEAENGAGISVVNGANLIIENSIVRNNHSSSLIATSYGGGIYVYNTNSTTNSNSPVSILNSSVYGNTATTANDMCRGGGVFVENNYSSTTVSPLTINNSNIFNNHALSSYASIGGGVHFNSQTVSSPIVIKNSIIFNNRAFADSSMAASSSTGGGIYAISYGSSVLIDSCEIRGNNAKSSVNSRGGGTFLNSNVSISVLNSDFYNNDAVSIASSLSNYLKTEGGGLHLSPSTAPTTIQNNKFYNNTVSVSSNFAITASSYGGGVYSYSSSNSLVSITNNLIYNNTATTSTLDSTANSQGGGIFVDNVNQTSSIVITNTDIYGNSISLYSASNSILGASSSDGGGAYLRSSRVSINESNIYNNTSTASNREARGGGMLIYSSINGVLVKNSSIYNNSVSSTNGLSCGGGLAVDVSSASIDLIKTNIHNNTASSTNSSAQGGGVFNPAPVNFDEPHPVNITNCNINNNRTLSDGDSYGGGVYGILINVTNSVLNNNLASSFSGNSYGGGVYSTSNALSYSSIPTPVIINNSSIYKNTASSNAFAYGGGVYTSASDPIRVNNSIFAYNTGGASPHSDGSTTNINYSYFSGEDRTVNGLGNFNGITVNPLFVDTLSGDYRLSANSTLIDAGINDSIPLDFYDIDNDLDFSEQNPLDLASQKRIIGSNVDLGAYEFCESSSTQSITVCGSLTSPSGKYVWLANGTYFDTIANVNGCDSLMTIILTVNNKPVNTVSVSGVSITANAFGVHYEWVDCNNNYSLLGDTNQIFTPTSTGNYAVIVDNGNCKDTSVCTPITVVGINELEKHIAVNVFPNPTTNIVDVIFDELNNYVLQLIDVSGKVILTKEVSTIKSQLDLSTYERGIYFVRVKNLDKVSTLRLILQ